MTGRIETEDPRKRRPEVVEEKVAAYNAWAKQSIEPGFESYCTICKLRLCDHAIDTACTVCHGKK